jgi:hypothetical protein
LVLQTPGQELGCHSHSHLYCSEDGIVESDFDADLACSRKIFSELNVKPVSFVFPRNQVHVEYLDVLAKHGYTSYRGNYNHWLYRDGHMVMAASHQVYRVLRMVDSFVSLTGHHTFNVNAEKPVTNIPGSRFLRPITNNAVMDGLHTNLIKQGMLDAAKNGRIFHVWGHPHNFGKYSEANLARLEDLLKYFKVLQEKYGMVSLTMEEAEKASQAA